MPADLHALLIGIDAYLPNNIEGVGYYPRLQGCVRDMERVETFLRKESLIPLGEIEKLTASAYFDVPVESRERWPTYTNMVAAFARLTAAADPGDSVYIHYSGHGNQTRTIFPEIKGENGLDEVLVPVDIGLSEAGYLRDVEIAYFLRVMVEKGLFVTLVLDSCHSAGATRDEKPGILVDGKLAMPRSVPRLDFSTRRSESLVASREELLASWRWQTVRVRDFQPSTGWLPSPRDYVLIAACTSRQTAYEYAFEGTQNTGALTHFLLGAMAELSPGVTYSTLYNRLRARVEAEFPIQTPMLVGESQRIVFGAAPSATPRSQEPDPGPNLQRITARLAPALSALANLLSGSPFLYLAHDGETADLQVVVNSQQEIEVQDSSGVPLPSLHPSLIAKDPGAGVAAIERLVHLARYRSVLQLENRQAPPELAGKIAAELLGIEDHVDTTRRPAPLRVEGKSSLEMREKQWTYLRITNFSTQDLNFAVLDLQPDWGITQIIPGMGEENLLPLASGQSFILPLQAQLPKGIDSGRDVLKVFATLGTADFRWLELPTVGQLSHPIQATRSLPPPLPKKTISEFASASTEWTTVKVEVRIRPASALTPNSQDSSLLETLGKL